LPINLENSERITTTALPNMDIVLFYRLERAWGGAYWELRQKLGQDAVDKSVYRAWRELTDQDHTLVARSLLPIWPRSLRSRLATRL